jgi:diguanylate cyclase (GGDEF)-like protein/PAS domain S-box-containing protein
VYLKFPAILTWNEKNEIVNVNHYFLQLFEIDIQEVMGNKWYSYIQPNDGMENALIDFEQFLKGETSRKFETKIRLKSGKVRHILWNASRLQFPEISGDLVVSFGIDVTAEKETEELLYDMAYSDALTGLKNRAVFESDITSMIDSDLSFTLLYLDIDDFKNLNDVYGHNFGDEFIKDYACRLKTIFDSSFIYRWYGDKFLLMMHETSEEQIATLTDKIMSVTKQCWNLKHVAYYPSVSIGITQFPKDGNTLADMMKNVDLALFRAKLDEKTKVVAYEKSFQIEIEERILIENKISDALENDGFKLNFQPIYSLPQNRISGMEVLLRLKHDTAGISTGKLIEIAEETGKILFIDFWVIEHAFQFMNENMSDQNFMININLSAKTVNSTKLLKFLIKCIDQYNVRPENVEFEITEHSLIYNMEDTKKLIEALKNLGFRISLDDFGTRYSSLNYLCSIPFDSLKIDKSYVDNIMDDRNEEAVIEQIIQLSKRLGLKTIAEGIEREEQRKIISDLGCDYAQGYLLARPMESEKLLELIHE